MQVTTLFTVLITIFMSKNLRLKLSQKSPIKRVTQYSVAEYLNLLNIYKGTFPFDFYNSTLNFLYIILTV